MKNTCQSNCLDSFYTRNHRISHSFAKGTGSHVQNYMLHFSEGPTNFTATNGLRSISFIISGSEKTYTFPLLLNALPRLATLGRDLSQFYYLNDSLETLDFFL